MDRNMKKLTIILITVVMMFLMGISVCAAEETEIYNDYMQSSGADELLSSVPSDTVEILSELGIDEVSFESIFNVSFKGILKSIASIFKEKSENPIKAIVGIMGVIILTAIAKCFQTSEKDTGSAIGFASVLLCAFAIVVPITKSLSGVLSAIKLSSDFMLAFIPVFAVLVTVSGNPVLALSYNSLVLGVSEIVSQVSGKILSPFVSMMISLNVVASVSSEVHIERATRFIKTAVTVILTFMATIFTGFLTTKGLLSNSADTVSAKGIKFLAGNLIPVIGGAVSDAYSSIVGSLGLLKGAVGFFGIFTVIAINLPIICETILWIAALYIGEFCSELFGEKNISTLLKGTSQAIQITLAILVFNLFLMIVSTGIILTIKADL